MEYELLLPGQRVCINPDSSDYRFFRDEYGLSGTIVWIPGGLDCIKGYKDMDMDDKKDFMYNILFDESKKNKRVRRKDLLPIDKTVTVTKYILNPDGVCYQIDNEENDRLDKLIIKNGHKISSVEIYDDNWREKVKIEILQQE